MTPPFGANIFVACGIAKIPIEQVAWKLFPFIFATILALFVVTFVPWIVMLVPTLLGYVR